jgi:Flagellar hook-length control protein FliK
LSLGLAHEMHQPPRIIAPFGLLTLISALENSTTSSPALGALSSLGANSGARNSVSFAAMCAAQLSVPDSNGSNPLSSSASVTALSDATAGSGTAQEVIITKAAFGSPNPKDSAKNPSPPAAGTVLAAFLLLPMPALPNIVLPAAPNKSFADPSSSPSAPVHSTNSSSSPSLDNLDLPPSSFAALAAVDFEPASLVLGGATVNPAGALPSNDGNSDSATVPLSSWQPATDPYQDASLAPNLPNLMPNSFNSVAQSTKGLIAAFENPSAPPASVPTISNLGQAAPDPSAAATGTLVQPIRYGTDSAVSLTVPTDVLLAGSPAPTATGSQKAPVQTPGNTVQIPPVVPQTQSSSNQSEQNLTLPSAVDFVSQVETHQSNQQARAVGLSAPLTRSAAAVHQSPEILEILSGALHTLVPSALALSAPESHLVSPIPTGPTFRTIPPANPPSVLSPVSPSVSSPAAPSISAQAASFSASAGTFTPGTNPAAAGTLNPIAPSEPVGGAQDSPAGASDASDSSLHKGPVVAAAPSAGSSSVVLSPVATAQAVSPPAPTVTVVDPAIQTTTGQPSASGSNHKSENSAPATSPDSAPNLSPNGEPPATPATGPVQMAQMVSKAAQSEMRIGLNTSAFGSVEVRTIVHANDVGVVIGSEKGDLRSLLSNELPGIANSLQQQNLRLNQVNFHQGFASSNNQSSGGDAQPRSFARPVRTTTLPAEISNAESNEAASTVNTRGSGLSILA